MFSEYDIGYVVGSIPQEPNATTMIDRKYVIKTFTEGQDTQV